MHTIQGGIDEAIIGGGFDNQYNRLAKRRYMGN